jgi:hypothetical protein
MLRTVTHAARGSLGGGWTRLVHSTAPPENNLRSPAPSEQSSRASVVARTIGASLA